MPGRKKKERKVVDAPKALAKLNRLVPGNFHEEVPNVETEDKNLNEKRNEDLNTENQKSGESEKAFDTSEEFHE